MPKVKVGDINIYYEEYGKGEPLVIINGAGASTQMFSGFIPIYSQEYRLILFDKRGEGQSDTPDIPYTTEMMADDLAGLLDVIGIDSAHIRGISLGGMIAQQFAIHYPKRVKSLILMCTYCGGPHSILPEETTRLTDMGQMQKMTAEERARETIRLAITKEFLDKNPGVLQRMMAVMTEHPIITYGTYRQGQAVKAHNTYKRLPEIKVPTLIIAGEADRLMPVENSKIMASRIPGAELVILKNTGHMLMEAGAEVNKLTLDFLKRHRTSG
jgi:3-oxoadipate enol-lactonase